MTIRLEHPYMSIKRLSVQDLPDFAVVFGRNGVGKTQLLNALQEGQASMAGVERDEVEKYDMETFTPRPQAQEHWGSCQFAATTAHAYFARSPEGQSPHERACEIYGWAAGAAESSGELEASVRRHIALQPDFSQFHMMGGSDAAAEYSRRIAEQVIAPMSASGISQRQERSGFGDNPAVLVSLAMKLASKLPHELTRDDILRAWNYEGELIDSKLNRIFVAYLVDQFLWAHREIETASPGMSFQGLMDQYATSNPAPWAVLRETLDDMRREGGEDGLFNFEFSDPSGVQLNMATFQDFAFEAVLTNRSTGDVCSVDTLSSGERVLMSLCLMSFNQRLGRRKPRLLLLDEVDAVLHPSMVRALFTMIRKLFVGQGTKVLMTTHSPVTVAMLDQGEIFRMTRSGGNVQVTLATKSAAVGELSERMCTVDVGLRIAAYDAAKVTILTEGNNVLHLKKWAELHFEEYVRVFDELPDATSSSQLSTYGLLLARMVTNTHFVIVWDCDASKHYNLLKRELSPTSQVTAHLLEARESRIAPSGIENKYDEDLLKRFANTTTDPEGEVVGYKIGGDQKKRLAEYVCQEATREDFRHFEDLRATVETVLAREHN